MAGPFLNTYMGSLTQYNNTKKLVLLLRGAEVNKQTLPEATQQVIVGDEIRTQGVCLLSSDSGTGVQMKVMFTCSASAEALELKKGPTFLSTLVVPNTEENWVSIN